MSLSSLPLADLQVFAQVVQQRSFAAAARQLGLTTSAVSRSVGRLEAQLGVKLLLRTTRRSPQAPWSAYPRPGRRRRRAASSRSILAST